MIVPYCSTCDAQKASGDHDFEMTLIFAIETTLHIIDRVKQMHSQSDVQSDLGLVLVGEASVKKGVSSE